MILVKYLAVQPLLNLEEQSHKQCSGKSLSVGVVEIFCHRAAVPRDNLLNAIAVLHLLQILAEYVIVYFHSQPLVVLQTTRF